MFHALRCFIFGLAIFFCALTAHAAAWPDLSTPPAAQGGGEGDAALLIAIEDYLFLPDVYGANDNARDWRSWLRETRGVRSIKVLADHTATREAIIDEVRRAASRVGEGGTLWLLFIGHGAPSQDGRDGVIIGADAQLTSASLYSRSVQRAELLSVLEEGSQAHSVVVLDACFSGKQEGGQALIEGLQPSLLSGSWRPGRATVLTAARGDQFAGPLPGAARPAFSYLLLGALRGWGDQDGDGAVTAAEALEWTSDTLYEVVQGRVQEPELFGPGTERVLGYGVEASPDLSGFALEASSAGAARLVDSGGLSVGSSGGSSDILDQIAQLELARQQRQAAEAAATEAARREAEALARLEAERVKKLDGAEEAKEREATEVWARMLPLVQAGGPEARRAVELFVGEYSDAKVWVEDLTGRYERDVRFPEVTEAKELLAHWPSEDESRETDTLESLLAERERQLDAAEAVLAAEAVQLWTRLRPLVQDGGAKEKYAVEAFVQKYGTAKVWVKDSTGRHERAVRVPEVLEAQALLARWPREDAHVALDPVFVPPDTPAPSHSSRGLLAGGLGTALAGGALLAASAALDAQFLDTSDQTDAERLYTLNHAAFWSGTALGVTGTGLVVIAVVRGRW